MDTGAARGPYDWYIRGRTGVRPRMYQSIEL